MTTCKIPAVMRTTLLSIIVALHWIILWIAAFWIFQAVGYAPDHQEFRANIVRGWYFLILMPVLCTVMCGHYTLPTRRVHSTAWLIGAPATVIAVIAIGIGLVVWAGRAPMP